MAPRYTHLTAILTVDQQLIPAEVDERLDQIEYLQKCKRETTDQYMEPSGRANFHSRALYHIQLYLQRTKGQYLGVKTL